MTRIYNVHADAVVLRRRKPYNSFLYVYHPTLICGISPEKLRKEGILRHSIITSWEFILLNREYDISEFENPDGTIGTTFP